MTEKLKKIGKYDIVSELGKGAMGIVYKGLDPVINRYVAIKTLSKHDTDTQGNELADRFKQEAQAAGRLNHPGIVSVYEYAEDGDTAFIAMELVEGYTLSDRNKLNIQLSLSEIWELMLQVLDALQFAHRKGVVHRDIKPSNIMRTASGEIKIADFGIARIESSELTQVGTIIGTPGYMSPEQLLGQPVDNRSDLFSCGILFYELLTGESAFSGTNITSTMYKVVHTDLPPASKICPTIPASVDDVLSKALAKNPDDRFLTAREFAEAISSIPIPEQRTPESLVAADIDPGKTIVQPTPSGANAGAETVVQPSRIDDPLKMFDSSRSSTPAAAKIPTPVKPEHTSTTRKKLLIITASLLVLALVAASVFLWMPGRDEKPLPPEAKKTPEEIKSPEGVPQITLPSYAAGTSFVDCPTCPKMIVIPPGSFQQGSPVSETNRESNEGPQHTVQIDYLLAVGQHEVTRQQFSQFVSETNYRSSGCHTYEESWQMRDNRSWQSPGFYQDSDEAVTCVSWIDARNYTNWLSKKTGEPYRLLSASEWEYVSRAGTQTSRSWGSDPDSACQWANVADESTIDDYAGWKIHNCMDGHLYTAPSEAFPANEFGVYSMLGNLFEWVEDCWNDSYQEAPNDGAAWSQGECSTRSLRGGSWYSQPQYVRSAFRNHFNRNTRASTFGIRVARELPSS